jgi:hypothetical protein
MAPRRPVTRSRAHSTTPGSASTRGSLSAAVVSTGGQSRSSATTGIHRRRRGASTSSVNTPHRNQRRRIQNSTSSIRTGARIQSISTGAQRGTTYHIENGRDTTVNRLSQQSAVETPMAGSTNNTSTRVNPQALHQVFDSAVDQSTVTEALAGVRACHCDRLISCVLCKADEPCADHIWVQCAGKCNGNDGRWFHVECTGFIYRTSGGNGYGSLVAPWDPLCIIDLDSSSQNNQPWLCLMCWESRKRVKKANMPDPTFASLENHLSNLPLRAERLGLAISSDDFSLMNGSAKRQLGIKLKKYHENLLDGIEDAALVESILNSKPRPYPTVKPMNGQERWKMAIHGRRFELLMLNIKIKACRCCGIVVPVQHDLLLDPKNKGKAHHPLTGTETKFKRHHLVNPFYDAYLCCCSGFCRGSQFYAKKRPTQIATFQEHHGQKHPSEFIRSNQSSSSQHSSSPVEEVVICKSCYHDLSGPNDSLSLARTFSSRNGFGPMGQPLNTMAQELETLLLKLTAAEEAAIRPITPLLSIMRLKQGNIGTKGNVSCVWQRSTLTHILPNLPTECSMIIIKRSNSQGVALPDYNFKRGQIHRVLLLLQATGLPPWGSQRVTFSDANLNAWPETGNLSAFGQTVTLQEEEHDNMTNINDSRVTDAGDAGPAPLQGGEEEGVTHSSVQVAGCGQADMIGRLANGTNELTRQLQAIVQEHQNSASSTDLPIPGPLIQINRESVTLQQNEAFPTGTFADMERDPLAWAMAFPTVFRPHLRSASDGSLVWTLSGDITRFAMERDLKNRDRKPTFTEWAKWMMWSSDGSAAKHPTFALVLHNHIHRKQLQTQGRVALSLDNSMDATLTAQEWLERVEADTTRDGLKSKLNYYAGNVRGTDQFWKAKLLDFRATAQYHSHINGTEANFFHTTSMAEYHDPFLRRAISKYVGVITNSEAGQAILCNQQAFVKAVSTYKQFVTHYFVCKMETWLSTFLDPVLNIEFIMWRNEFAKSRGAIHTHSIGGSRSEGDAEISSALDEWAASVHQASQNIKTHMFGLMQSEGMNLSEFQETDNAEEAMAARRSYLSKTEQGKVLLQQYDSTIESARTTAISSLVETLEGRFAFSADHIGVSPHQWLAPGGSPHLEYRRTSMEMQSKLNVLEQKELQQIKSLRELHLHKRSVNIQNHAFTHCCSAYCLKEKRMLVEYREAEHNSTNIDFICLVETDSGTKARIKVYECRMGFGFKLKYGLGPPNAKDFTGGCQPCYIPTVVIDPNGLPKFQCHRNHPRIVAEPVLTRHWGANADFQKFLVSNNQYAGDDYEDYCKNLQMAKMSGLESSQGACTCLEYCVGYCCKGAESSKEWSNTLTNIAKEYSHASDTSDNATAGQSVSMYKVVSKFMNQVSKSRDVTRDEASFLTSGGQLVYNTMLPRFCSVSSMEISDLAARSNSDGAHYDNSNSSGKTFTWKSIVTSYKNRATEFGGLSLYEYAGQYHLRQEVVPRFGGYNTKPSWPLEEQFSKMTLMIYCPWYDSVETLMLHHSTFSEALEARLNRSILPKHILVPILKKKTQWHFDEAGRAPFDTSGDAPNSTPTNNRNNSQLVEAANINQGNDTNRDSEHDADLNDVDFSSLFDGGPDFDWSVGYSESGEHWLLQTAKQFYQDEERRLANGTQASLELFDPTIYRPEACKGLAQKLLVGLAIMQMLHFKSFLSSFSSPNTLPPDSLFLYVQGNPGTGKTFVTRTILNIVRSIWGGMGYDMAVAPTGVAASLLRGKTDVRALKIPIGSKLQETPQPFQGKSINQFLAHCVPIRKLIVFAMDESSMFGREKWAWIPERLERARRMLSNLDEIYQPEEGSETPVWLDQMNNDKLCNAVCHRPWGGIPLIVAAGDCGQLPPVACKSHFDDRPASTRNTACAIGKCSFEEFLNLPDGSDTRSALVVMDQVIRQDDNEFKSVLEHMRNGTVGYDEADYCLDRTLSSLAEEDRELFEREALYLMPTWKRTLHITKTYLQALNKPVARVDCEYTTAHKTNHARKECNMPERNALCQDAMVMLLHNFLVEMGLKNGAIGKVVCTIYKNEDGPNGIGEGGSKIMPAYVVVDFPDTTLNTEDVWDQANPTHIPIPPIILRCEKKCCGQKQVPLRVCKAITIYKSQGLTCGEGHTFPRVVLALPEVKSRHKTAGLETVGASRATNPSCLAFDDTDFELTREHFTKIGTGAAYEVRNRFELRIKQKSITSLDRAKTWIEQFDATGQQNFDAGFDYLVSWFRNNSDTNING